MRKQLYTGPILSDRKRELEILVEAKELIEQFGKEDYVIEMRQPHVLGGETLVLSSRIELDKTYIGYRGFMDYNNLCNEIIRINEKFYQ